MVNPPALSKTVSFPTGFATEPAARLLTVLFAFVREKALSPSRARLSVFIVAVDGGAPKKVAQFASSASVPLGAESACADSNDRPPDPVHVDVCPLIETLPEELAIGLCNATANHFKSGELPVSVTLPWSAWIAGAGGDAVEFALIKMPWPFVEPAGPPNPVSDTVPVPEAAMELGLVEAERPTTIPAWWRVPPSPPRPVMSIEPGLVISVPAMRTP
jgi:hypothetical protein